MMWCLALTELHEKGTNIDDLVSRVYNSKELETCDKDDIWNKFYCISEAGACDVREDRDLVLT